MPAAPDHQDEMRQLRHVEEDLQREFPTLPRHVVTDRFHQLVAQFGHAPVRTFVPVLVQREARRSLRAEVGG